MRCLPCPWASGVSSHLPPPPAQCASSLRDLVLASTIRHRYLTTQAAATPLAAFARSALARTGDITDQSAALPLCPRALAASRKPAAALPDACASSPSPKPAALPRASPAVLPPPVPATLLHLLCLQAEYIFHPSYLQAPGLAPGLAPIHYASLAFQGGVLESQ